VKQTGKRSADVCIVTSADVIGLKHDPVKHITASYPKSDWVGAGSITASAARLNAFLKTLQRGNAQTGAENQHKSVSERCGAII
jgi:hypothetical protein